MMQFVHGRGSIRDKGTRPQKFVVGARRDFVPAPASEYWNKGAMAHGERVDSAAGNTVLSSPSFLAV